MVTNCRTGLVGLAIAQFGPPAQVYLTDQASHMQIMEENVVLNQNAGTIPAGCEVIAKEFDWGKFAPARRSDPA
jgi:hypothetical protein